MIISQTKTSFQGVVFDVDHDSEGPRAPKAHPDAVLTNLSRRLGRPFIRKSSLVPRSVITIGFSGEKNKVKYKV